MPRSRSPVIFTLAISFVLLLWSTRETPLPVALPPGERPLYGPPPIFGWPHPSINASRVSLGFFQSDVTVIDAVSRQLLTAEAPARSLYDALSPGLRYLTSDSWSGLSNTRQLSESTHEMLTICTSSAGHFTTAVSLLSLASQTQRIAIM